MNRTLVVAVFLCLASSSEGIRIVDGLVEKFPPPIGSSGMYVQSINGWNWVGLIYIACAAL